MGNGTKFKLSSMFPGVLSKIKGMTGGKRVKSKGGANPGDWSDDLQDSSASKDSPGSPVRTFPQNRDRDTQRHCSSPRCSSPVNHKSYDIRFPIESPVRRGGLKSRPISPPRRSINSTDSVDSTSLVQQDRIRRGRRSRCNSEMHSDSELDATDSESARGAQHLRVRTMSLQLDGTMDWERERERDWSEPENLRGSWRTRRMRDTALVTKTEREEEPSSPILTVRCMPPNTPSDIGNYSDPHDLDHRSACPDFSSRKITALQFHDRKLGFTADDTRLFDDTSFSSDDDFFKVRSGYISAQYRPKKVNNYVVSGDMTDDSEQLLTEDEERSLHAKTVRSCAAAGDGWGRTQSRFAEEEEKHQQQQRTTGRGGRMSYDRKAADGVTLTADERHHAVLSRRETSSLVKTVLSAKDWARENLRSLSKGSELEKQAKQQQQFIRATDSLVEYESFGLPVIHKEHHRQQYSRESSKTISTVGEVEKHTKGRIDYKSSPNEHHHHGSDNLVYEHFSQPLAEYASDFYKNAHTEESDFETSNHAPRPWEVEFPSYRSDRGTRRSGPLDVTSDSGGPTPRTNHRLSVQERSSGRTPRKQPPSSTTANTTSREALGRKSSRSSSPKVQDVSLINSTKPSARSGSPRRQELHSGKRSSSPRTPSAKHEVVSSKKVGRSQSPRRQEVSGRKSSSVSPFPGGQQQEASKKGNVRSESPAAYSRLDNDKKGAAAEGGNGRSNNQAMRMQEERPTVMGSDSVAVVKASYDPYQDFRESMVEMILENEIQTAEDLEELLQCYLSLNSAEYHSIIVQVFSDIWRDIFDH